MCIDVYDDADDRESLVTNTLKLGSRVVLASSAPTMAEAEELPDRLEVKKGVILSRGIEVDKGMSEMFEDK